MLIWFCSDVGNDAEGYFDSPIQSKIAGVIRPCRSLSAERNAKADAVSHRPETGMWEITPASRPASGNRVGTANWTNNAQTVLLKNSTRSLPQGRNGDYSSKWKVAHWKSVNTRAQDGCEPLSGLRTKWRFHANNEWKVLHSR
jgi:hypothetical protein